MYNPATLTRGYSSYPTAVEALSQLVREADQQKPPVYALEWHVDYWDYLGWRDPWGSQFATEHWYAYAHALLSSEYTPHVVSNGQVAVGYAGSLREQETDACVAVDQPSQRTLGVAAPQ